MPRSTEYDHSLLRGILLWAHIVYKGGIKFFLILHIAVIFVKFKTKLLFMKKILASLVSVSCLINIAYSQTTTCPPIRQSAIGVSFFLNDFITPNRIRTA